MANKGNIQKTLTGLAIIYLVVVTTFLLFKPRSIIEVEYEKPTASLEVLKNFGGDFRVLYEFNYVPIPHSTEDAPILFGHVKGAGIVQSIAFHPNSSGVGVGYSVDGQDEIHWINNGHCLSEWKAYSPQAIGMPVTLLEWNGDDDLAIGINTPLFYEKEFKLYFVNSQKDDKHIRSLHLYGYFKDFSFGEGNRLRI